MSKSAGKRTPDDHFYLFKSCIAGSVYPGIEISLRYVLDRIGVSYTDDPRQSSCAGFAVSTGAMSMMTCLALNARNLSLASETDDCNVLCSCPACYSNLKHCGKMLEKDEELREPIKSVLGKAGVEYDCSSPIHNAADGFLACLDRIKPATRHSLSGVRAVTHHGCHYSKVIFTDVTAGNYERPEVLDDILKAFGCEMAEYAERSLCCGGGLHSMVLDSEFTRAIAKRKLASIAGAKPDVIVTLCPGCTFNLDYCQESLAIESGLSEGIPVLCISELLALLLGADPYEIGLDMHAVPVASFLEKIGVAGVRK